MQLKLITHASILFMMVLVCVWLVWCEIGLLDGCGVINMNGWLVDVDWFIWNGLNVVNVLVGFISLKDIRVGDLHSHSVLLFNLSGLG